MEAAPEKKKEPSISTAVVLLYTVGATQAGSCGYLLPIPASNASTSNVGPLCGRLWHGQLQRQPNTSEHCPPCRHPNSTCHKRDGTVVPGACAPAVVAPK